MQLRSSLRPQPVPPYGSAVRPALDPIQSAKSEAETEALRRRLAVRDQELKEANDEIARLHVLSAAKTAAVPVSPRQQQPQQQQQKRPAPADVPQPVAKRVLLDAAVGTADGGATADEHDVRIVPPVRPCDLA